MSDGSPGSGGGPEGPTGADGFVPPRFDEAGRPPPPLTPPPMRTERGRPGGPDGAGNGAAAEQPPPVTGSNGATADSLLTVRDLRVHYSKGPYTVQAVAGISFTIGKGETLGLVGESGCGKSTTGRALVRLERITSGTIEFDGIDLTSLKGKELRRARTGIQMIFQDPVTSLNPRRRIANVVAEPLDIWGRGTPEERATIVHDMLELVGLDPDLASTRRPREFSGGQCQRISIARSLVLEPKMLVCDEVVSALDVSVQAQILNLLEDLKARYGLTMLFIAHDLAVVKNISDRVAVMYLGRLCEVAPSDTLYASPAHHYTQALMASAVDPDPTRPARKAPVTGEPPSPINPPSGCRFRTRCPRAEERCAAEVPELRTIAPGHTVACHFPLVGPVAPPPGSSDGAGAVAAAAGAGNSPG